MISITCKNLEVAFSDKGRLMGIFQDGKCISGQKREDFFLKVNVNGESYTDAEGFVFEKAQQTEGTLALHYRIPNMLQVVVYWEAMEEYLRLHAAFYNEKSGSAKEVSDPVFCLPAIKYESIEKDWFRSPGQGACYEVTSENITFIPDSHVADMKDHILQEDMYSTTPDKGAGLLAVENEDKNASIGFVSYCDRENVFPMTKVEQEGIYLIQKEKLNFDPGRFPEMDGGYLYLIPGRGYSEVLDINRF